MGRRIVDGELIDPVASLSEHFSQYNALPLLAASSQGQCDHLSRNRPQLVDRRLGAVLGANTTGRVLSVTQVSPRSNGMVRVRGLASSGRVAYNGYGPYGSGAYGALGYGYANGADLSFRCDVAPNGAIYSVSINRR